MGQSETRGHLKLLEILNDLGYETISEYPIGQYCVDCWLPELEVAVEFDGPIHRLKKRKDTQRDADLVENLGVRGVVRIRSKELANTEGLKQKIREELSRFGG